MTATIMVCSHCGGKIAETVLGVKFDLHDCTWVCPHCGTDWHPDDGWNEFRNLLIPWRASDHLRRGAE